jgi:hypothetical protein
MSKKIVIPLGLILMFLILGGIFYFSKWQNFSKFNPLAAASFLSQIDNEELLKSLEETKSELEKLKEEISLLKEKWESAEGSKTEIELKYQSEIDSLTAEFNELAEKLEAKEKKEKTEETITFCQKSPESLPAKNKIIFNEISWMGSENSPSDEWIELKNISGKEINLAGWQILNKSQRIKTVFDKETKISANGLLLLKRGDDFAGAIRNSDEALFLFDQNCNLEDEVLASPDWPAGDNFSKRTMERKSDFSWQTSLDPGGTPGKENSLGFVETEKEEILEPKISLSFPPETSVDKEFDVSLSVSNLKEESYDVKISILKISEESEQKRTISEISLTGEEWQDSYKYLPKVFSGNSFSGDFKLRVSKENQDFFGQAEILTKVRQSDNKKIVAEFKEKINLTKPQEIIPIGTPPPVETPSQPPSEPQPSTPLKILINEVQIAGQTVDDEFIELYNPTSQPIDLSNWKLTRKTAGGTEYTILSNRTTVKLEGTIPPRGYFLIVHPDSVFQSIADIVHYGSQSLAKDNTLILYNPSGETVDKIGWGNVQDYETSPFPQNPKENQSLERINFRDTDDNSQDFQLQLTPNPQNSTAG